MKSTNLLGTELRNSAEPLVFKRGMELRNSNGDIDPASDGYQYTIQTTTFLRKKVLAQKFFQVPVADYLPVVVGQGAWLENAKQNLTFDVAGKFTDGNIGTATGPSKIAQVDVAMASKTATFKSWMKGYQYNIIEVEKALASNNWDVVEGKMKALKRNWDLGIQEVGFLGIQDEETVIPGLLTNADVVKDTTTITQNIALMSDEEFQTFVATILGIYRENCRFTAWPNMFVIPELDYTGLGSAASATFPNITKLEYLEKVFKMLTRNPGFKILPLAYCDLDNNIGRVAVGGKNRYVLYNNDPETLWMDLPVDFRLLPALPNTPGFFNGAGLGQYGGCVVYRVPEVMYFDHD